MDFVVEVPVVFSTGGGNPPAVWVWTGETVWFDSRTVQITRPAASWRFKPDPVPVNQSKYSCEALIYTTYGGGFTALWRYPDKSSPAQLLGIA